MLSMKHVILFSTFENFIQNINFKKKDIIIILYTYIF